MDVSSTQSEERQAPIGTIPRIWPHRIFYGWMIVCISFWGSMLTAGIGSYGFSVFLPVLSSTFGWSRGLISVVSPIRILTTMVLAPFLGRYADTPRGPRILMMSGAIVAGVALLLLSLINSIWQFYLLFGVLWGGAMIALGGQILGPTIVSKWFIRRRGRALAVATMGVSAGGVVAIPLATVFINAFGWRLAWVALGVVMLGTMLPLGAIFMRRQPEDVGLLPDGEVVADDGQSNLAKVSAIPAHLAIQGSFTVKQALRTRPFWALVAVQTLGSMSLSPVLFHQVAYVNDKGFSLTQSALIGTLVALFAALGKVPWGIAAERVPVRFVMTTSFTLAGASLLILVRADSLTDLYLYAVFFGLGMGSMPPLSNISWASYFGRRNLGNIRGWATPLTRWTGGASPLFAGLVYDRAGSYDFAFIVFSTTWILAGLVVLLAGPPREPELVAGDDGNAPQAEPSQPAPVASS